MLTREEKSLYRQELFQYLDGLGAGPSTYVLYTKGVLDHILKKKQINVSKVAEAFQANEGYLNVACRLMASQGWLNQEIDNTTDQVQYSTTECTPHLLSNCELYKDVYGLLVLSGKYHKRLFEKEPFDIWLGITKKLRSGYGITPSKDLIERGVQEQILKHIEGMLLAPSLVALGMNGMFHQYFMEHSFKAEEFHQDAESFTLLLDFFAHLGWFNRKNDTFQFTDKGLFFAKRASAFGVTVSYNPTFRHMETLLFGDPYAMWDVPEGQPEKHVDRAMNVWGSGGAHSAYFKKVDDIIIALFNKPIHEQPKGIVDMGCGNGAYLEHLFDVIEQRTKRGKMLDEYPLFLVGADFNEVALKVSRANLINADIWAKVIKGDISRPDLLANDLQDNYGMELGDLLNVRTFLDHNRIWEDPDLDTEKETSTSTGAYAFRGKRLSNTQVEKNLTEHLKRWTPYLKKFGLLVIELHTIPPALTAANLGKTAATAYDATHGFSDQYIVEIEVFHRIAAKAGLLLDKEHFSKFPNSDLATVSINLFKAV
ncbi:MAG: class I SAM-dependent methyltransferase [Flavobacteriaceae bacterium]|nr:class I SAM-dependent methyltransferase [Flavobacteriaceae bacterium]